MEMNEILTRLQNGESADTLAKEMSDTLNKAVKQVEAEKKSADREHQLAQEVADKINEYVEFKGIKSSPMDADDVITILDEVVKTTNLLNQFADLFSSHADKCDCDTKKNKSADDTIAEFLKMFD